MDAMADLPQQVDTDAEDAIVNIAVGKELKARRRAMREEEMSQRELSERVGVTRNTIQRIEAGERALNMGLLRKIAKVLEFRPSDFILAVEVELDVD